MLLPPGYPFRTFGAPRHCIPPVVSIFPPSLTDTHGTHGTPLAAAPLDSDVVIGSVIIVLICNIQNRILSLILGVGSRVFCDDVLIDNSVAL